VNPPATMKYPKIGISYKARLKQLKIAAVLDKSFKN
jgi:hypothetical protein